MKKQLFIGLILFGSILTLNAQWSYPNGNAYYPTNVGIGIAQPLSNLHINNSGGQSVVRLSSNIIKYGALLQFERFNNSNSFFLLKQVQELMMTLGYMLIIIGVIQL